MNKFIALLFLFIYPLAVYPQGISNEQLMEKIKQLENRVTILENIIADNNLKKTQNVVPIESDKQIWRKLNKGMNQDNVKKLLGEPLTIRSGPITYWYYSKSMIHSYVIFDNDNSVMGWNEPE